MNDFDDNREEKDAQDALWEVLGKAKQNAVSPLFSRNVLREIRKQPQTRLGAGLFAWLLGRRRMASACALAAVLLAAGAVCFVPRAGHDSPAPTIAQNAPQAEPAKAEDTEVVAHLDELVAYEENSIWLEDSSN